MKHLSRLLLTMAGAITASVSLADHFFDPSMAMVYRGPTNVREVALTFDDGPHPATCAQILDTLKAARVPASFFVVGKKVIEHPDLVRRMIREGHEVGNHTFTHPRLDELNETDIRKELVECQWAIRAATGKDSIFFRPPGMRYDETVENVAKSLGYVTINWNAAAKDFIPDKAAAGSRLAWSDDAREIADRVLEHVKNGSIILLHDSQGTADALPEIISGLKASGYRIVSLTHMLRDLPRPMDVESNPVAERRVNAETHLRPGVR